MFHFKRAKMIDLPIIRIGMCCEANNYTFRVRGFSLSLVIDIIDESFISEVT